ncbi:response regulator [Pseudomonas denitrificans (nom. rej.)]|nr:response regulator [Pseudomonas denitrificans (nom. rej.)]
MNNRPYKEKSVLLVDDEPEYVQWLYDYLVAKGFDVDMAESVAEALKLADATNYRLYLVDLNIPDGSWKSPSEMPEIYAQYKGLNVIRYVRSQGNAGRRVVAYSAHENDEIHAAIKTLYCQYVVKGRAKDLKMELESVLQHDPQTSS